MPLAGYHNNGSDVTKLPNADKPIQVGVPGKYWVAAGVLAVVLLVAMAIPQLLQKWLWMRQLDYADIFWTLLSVKWGMACAAFIGAFLFLWINIRQAAINCFALAERDTESNAGPGEKTRGIEIGGFAISGRVVMRSLLLLRRRRRGGLCAWLLHAMGHLSPLSLRWFLRIFRPGLRNRRGVLSLYASVLSTPAVQSRIIDGAGDRRRRQSVCLFRSDATQARSAI